MKRKFWEPREVATLRALYPFLTAQELEPILGRAAHLIHRKAWTEGLKKHPECIARLNAQLRERALADTRPLERRFKPGHVPKNKGQPMPEHVRRAASGHWFRKGHVPFNWMPVGATRIGKDGLLERKYTTAGRGGQRWRSVHRMVWEAAHGPVPAGHIVIFKPGLRTTVLQDITVDRLECISLAENMKRNTRHNLPKPINDLIALRGALNRQINRKAKQQEPRP